MEIKDLNDFYIDLDGDIKATTDRLVASFVTDTDKLNSKYLIAKDIQEIKDCVFKIDPNFIIDSPIIKQYAIKIDKNNQHKGIKIFIDFNDGDDKHKIIWRGIEIYENEIFNEYYLISNKKNIEDIISTNRLRYEVKEFDTHSPILYSVKYNSDNKIINFKTYYVRKDSINLYDNNFINTIKQTLKF